MNDTLNNCPQPDEPRDCERVTYRPEEPVARVIAMHLTTKFGGSVRLLACLGTKAEARESGTSSIGLGQRTA